MLKVTYRTISVFKRHTGARLSIRVRWGKTQAPRNISVRRVSTKRLSARLSPSAEQLEPNQVDLEPGFDCAGKSIQSNQLTIRALTLTPTQWKRPKVKTYCSSIAFIHVIRRYSFVHRLRMLHSLCPLSSTTSSTSFVSAASSATLSSFIAVIDNLIRCTILRWCIVTLLGVTLEF